MKTIFRNLTAAALLALSGCSGVGGTADRQRFEQITEDLDFNGSCFFAGSAEHAGKSVENLLRNIERQVWYSGMPESARFRMQRFISLWELIARIGGINEIRGWGGSSIKFASEDLFRNRFKLLLAPEARGVLWQLPAKENIPLGKYLQNLPDDTFFACVFNLVPFSAARLLKTDNHTIRSVDQICKLLLGCNAAELLSELSGVWKLVIVCDEVYDPGLLAGVHIALTIPDRNGKIFALMQNRSKLLAGVKHDAASGTVQLTAFPDKLLVPVIKKGNGSLTVFSTPEAQFRTSNNESFPKVKQRQKDLLKYLDDSGVAAVYNRSSLAEIHLSGKQGNAHHIPSLGILQRRPDGLFFEEISGCDINSYALYSATAFPVRMLFDIFNTPPQSDRNSKSTGKKAPPKQQIPVKPVQKNIRKSANTADSCLANLSRIGAIVIKEAAAAKKYPVYGIQGLRELAAAKKLSPAKMCCPAIKKVSDPEQILSYANCHYLYFGAPAEKSPKSPLIIELPFLHKDYIAVCCANGSTEKIPMTGIRNVRRAISVLHTMHAYEEEEFFRLMRIAEEFDKILER